MNIPTTIKEISKFIKDDESASMTLAARVFDNNAWLENCHNIHRKEMKRNGDYARKTRESRKISLRQLAKQMGCSAPHLSDLELGNRNWTEKTLTSWARSIETKL